MSRIFIFFFLVFLQSFVSRAQNTLYDFIELGDYQVGFMDTIIFDTKYQYEAFDYVGNKPSFIQIWYPMAVLPANPNCLKFADLFDGSKTDMLSNVQAQLIRNYQEAVFRDCIEENLLSGEANDFGSFTYDDILNLIGETKTGSFVHNAFTPSQFPIIVYHHGSQSFSFENYAMAEYFASRGFIFVSANFHLPYENTIFGLKPYDSIIKGEEEQSLKTILRFAKSLSDSQDLFFIGHSWGAQMGLRTLDSDTTIKGFISLETTLEFKSDQAIIKEMWPEVFQKVITEKGAYPFPILFCAATGQAKPFLFFENINAPQIAFAPTREEFEHNAYLSTFYLRLFLDKNINQPDKEVLNDRLRLYVKHLELMAAFMNGIRDNEDKPGNELKFVGN